jgi:dienelactone hydrolase
MYLSMGDKLASLPSHQAMLVLRLDYRYPARNKYCVPDVLAAMDYLQRTFQIQRVVLVGWSFGGAPAFTVGGMDDRVAGVATVASQTAETEGISQMGPNKPVLLLHGTGDRTLSPQCSKRLQDMYGSRGECTLKLFAGDDHGLTRNAEEAEEVLCRFILRCGGVRDEGLAPTIESHMMAESKEEKLDLMRKGGDLRGEERI